jgi:hypothetical protein
VLLHLEDLRNFLSCFRSRIDDFILDNGLELGRDPKMANEQVLVKSESIEDGLDKSGLAEEHALDLQV